MYAVIETGGKQYRVELGTELEVELIDAPPGGSVTLDRVLLVADGERASIGRPLVANATVAAEVVRQTRGAKVVSFKYRPKARRRVKKGHRQELTVLRISDIVFDGRSAAATAEQAADARTTERQRLEEAARRQAEADAALAAQLAMAAEAAKAAAPPKPAPAKGRAARADSTPPPARRTRVGAEKAAADASSERPKAARGRTRGATEPATKPPTEKPDSSAAPKRARRTKKDE